MSQVACVCTSADFYCGLPAVQRSVEEVYKLRPGEPRSLMAEWFPRMIREALITHILPALGRTAQGIDRGFSVSRGATCWVHTVRALAWDAAYVAGAVPVGTHCSNKAATRGLHAQPAAWPGTPAVSQAKVHPSKRKESLPAVQQLALQVLGAPCSAAQPAKLPCRC